ncbi:MAG: DUF2442 domain-containing protein [Campylobacterales bacterium]|nr:DUF2442 domain-containing protein [Campylobacterales bacterium]
MEPFIEIQDAKYLEEYKIYLKFDDGKEKIVDFSNFILNAKHPDIKKYQDIQNFKAFNLEYGDLEWNDYELAFPIYDLYNKSIL